jgi:hypothetical protein
MTASNRFLNAFMASVRSGLFLALAASLHCLTATAGELPVLLKKTVLLSPEINGRLVNAGVPLAGRTVIRYLNYDNDYEDEAVTDSEGRFHFDPVSIKSARPNNPFDETRIFQLLKIIVEGQEVVLWGHTREIPDRKGIPYIDKKLSGAVFDVSLDYAHYIFLSPDDGFTYAIIGNIKADDFHEKNIMKDMGI